MNTRLERLRARLREVPLESLLVSGPENRRYLSGFTGSAGFLLVSQRAALLATDFRYFEQAPREAPGFDLFRLSREFADQFIELAAVAGVKQVGFEGEHLSFYEHQILAEAARAAGLEFVPTRTTIEEMRVTKAAEEVDRIERAAELTDRCFAHVLNIVAVGMTEYQLAWEIEKFMRESGADGLAFDTIVASGPNSALPHYRPGGRPLALGEPIVIDMGARLEGYCSDFTRTICLGEPDDKFWRVYNSVLRANEAAVANIRGGMTGQQADDEARRVIAQEGYAEAFGHGLGHGVGLEIHESPRLGPRSQEVLRDGMVVTVEPGIYLPDWGGVRIEDLAVIEESRVRLLSHATRDPLVVAAR